MASISEINASAPNKSKLEETQCPEITVNFGVFFDGTNNQRLQVAMGKLNREKNAEKKKEQIKKTIEELGATFDEKQYKKNGNISYIFKNNCPPSDYTLIEALNKKISKYNKKYGNRLDDNERDTVESFTWDDASGKKKDGETNQKALKRKSKSFPFRIGMPRSFMQGVDFTNIARLEPLYDFNQNDATTYKYRIYVSGSGTFADVNKGMDISGLAFGQGSAGVVQKVKDALDAITEKIKAIKCNGNIKEVNYKINVFGFSRGATEARLFVDLFSERRAEKRHDRLKDIISECNKEFIDNESNASFISFPKLGSLEFPFVGLFDTVSSVGITPGIWNDAIAIGLSKAGEAVFSPTSKRHEKNKEELGLDTLVYDDKVKHIVHICALDEYRENFALQVMPANNSKVEQFFMPGIHTDIGGGDLDGYDEEKYIAKTHDNKDLYIPKIVTPGKRQKASDLFIITKDNMQQLGWIKDSTNSSLMSDIVKEEKDIIRTQRYSEHGYAYLPLTILAKKACENTCKFENLEDKYSIPDDLPQSFDSMKTAWAGADSKYGHCYFPKEDSKYKLLRQRFLHFSSNIKKTAVVIVNGPNITASKDKDSVFYYDRFLDYQQPPGWYGKITDLGITDITFEKIGNLNNDEYLGEAVVVFNSTGNDYNGNRCNAKVTIYGLDGQQETFLGATTPWNISENYTITEGFYNAYYQDMPTSIYGERGPQIRKAINAIVAEIKIKEAKKKPIGKTNWGKTTKEVLNTIVKSPSLYRKTVSEQIMAVNKDGDYQGEKVSIEDLLKVIKSILNKETIPEIQPTPSASKTYKISKYGKPKEEPDGKIANKDGKGKAMSGVYLHRTNNDGNAKGSSSGCLVIDGTKWKDVEKLLGESQNILIYVNRTSISTPQTDQTSTT